MYYIIILINQPNVTGNPTRTAQRRGELLVNFTTLTLHIGTVHRKTTTRQGSPTINYPPPWKGGQSNAACIAAISIKLSLGNSQKWRRSDRTSRFFIISVRFTFLQSANIQFICEIGTHTRTCKKHTHTQLQWEAQRWNPCLMGRIKWHNLGSWSGFSVCVLFIGSADSGNWGSDSM